MLPLRVDKSNLSPFKKGTGPRADCRGLFPAEHHTAALSPKENRLSRHDQFFEDARKSARDIALHGAPLPLAWVGQLLGLYQSFSNDALQVLVLDNIIPDYAVPCSEAYGGPQFIARAFLDVTSYFFTSFMSI